MYRISSGSNIIHDPLRSLEGRVSISPVLTRELNRHGSLSFDVAPSNPTYDDLTPRTTYVSVSDSNGEIWRGRIISIQRGWNNVRKVYCEGELSYLNDSRYYPFLFRGTRKQLFGQLIYRHNNQVDSARQFTLDSDGTTLDDSTQITVCTDTAQSVWETLDEYILNYGYIVTYRDGDAVKIKCISKSDLNAESDQTVEYAKNLLNLTQNEDASNVITRLIPYGGLLEEGQPGYVEDKPSTPGIWNGNRLTIATADGQNGSLFIRNQAAEAVWGVVVGTATFDSIKVNGTTAANVKTAANALLRAAQGELTRRIGETISINVSAIDLSMVSPAIDSIEIGDYVWVVSKYHNIKIRLLCKKSTLYLTQPDKNVFSLGAGFKTLTDLSGSTIEND